MSLAPSTKDGASDPTIDASPREGNWFSRHAVLTWMISAIIVSALGGGLVAFVSYIDQRNLTQNVTAYTEFQNEVPYDIIVLGDVGTRVEVETDTVILYSNTLGNEPVDLWIAFATKDGSFNLYRIPYDSIRIATYLPETSATFSFVNGIINGSPGSVMTPQAFINRNLDDFRLNLTNQQYDDIHVD